MSRDFGDFQTPPPLVSAILQSLGSLNITWTRALEPTCGRGNFIEGLLKQVIPPCEIQGLELQDEHVRDAQQAIEHTSSTNVLIRQGNIFDVSLDKELCWNDKGPLLVIGNPPWVTNSQLGVLESKNLPQKTNIKKLQGLEARTGGANFDIAEYIWLKLIRELASEQPTIALLCKTSVARNVLQHAFDMALPIKNAFIRKIDAKKWFGAAVDACLFCVEVRQGEQHYTASVYQDLYTTQPESVIGIVDGHLVADVRTHNHINIDDKSNLITWRQGVKHDAASVMELIYDSSGIPRNKLGEHVIVEPDYLYPLLKSSDLFHYGSTKSRKAVVVTQKKLGENTQLLKQTAPKLWVYLTRHAQTFEQRKSSIYKGQRPFTMFGIGDYSFAPYKVAISGLHKMPRFRAIGPINGRPVMLDDTCYFVPCYSPYQAALLASIFNDPLCLNYINSIVFLDAKRPITKKLLQRIPLSLLVRLAQQESALLRAASELIRLGAISNKQELVWPSIEEIFSNLTPSVQEV